MNRWSLLLHIYQPPGQRADILDLVTREGYEPLLDFLLTVSAPVTLNVTGSLTDQLAKSGHEGTLHKLRQLYDKPNITFTHTAFTHALLPLWSDDVVVDQFSQNLAVQREQLNDGFASSGAWLPECAYQPRLEPLLRQQGVKWAVIDESSLTGAYRPAVRRETGGLRLAVRRRDLSQALATDVEQFGRELDSQTTDALAALDGEVFGHFDPHALDRLRLVFERYGNRLIPLDKLSSGSLPIASVRPSSWETERRDQLRRRPFPLWQDRRNYVHRAMWDLYDAVWRRLAKTDSWRQDQWVHRHFTNAISSCWFWWANPRRTAGPFRLKVWNPDMIVEGLTELIRAVRSDPTLSPRTKWQLETRYADVLKLVWRTHWKLQS